MRKKTFVRAIALVACISILSLSVPAVSAVERDGNRFELKIFVKKQMEKLTSLLPFLSKIFNTEKDTITPDDNTIQEVSSEQVKTTGGLSIIKPPRGGDKGDG